MYVCQVLYYICVIYNSKVVCKPMHFVEHYICRNFGKRCLFFNEVSHDFLLSKLEKYGPDENANLETNILQTMVYNGYC